MSLMKVLKFVGGEIITMPLEIIGRQLEFYQQRKNAEHDQRLRQQDAYITQQMAQENAAFMQELTLESRRINAEIDNMIAENEIERGTRLLEVIKDYQITMAKTSNSIQESLGKMTIELRRQAHDLIEEKKTTYLKMQKDVTAGAMEQLKEIKREFPEGSVEHQIMSEAIRAQLVGIVENSNSFMRMIDADFAKLVAHLDDTSKLAAANANEYISLTLGRLMPNQIRSGADTKLLR